MLAPLVIVVALCSLFFWVNRGLQGSDLVVWGVKAALCVVATALSGLVSTGTALRVSCIAPFVLMVGPALLARIGERVNDSNPSAGVAMAKVAAWLHPVGSFRERPMVIAAQNAVQAGDWDEADKHFGKLEAIDPRNRHWRCNFKGDDAGLVEALADGPRDQSELLALARANFRLGRATEAIDLVGGYEGEIHPITASVLLALVGHKDEVDEVAGISTDAASLWVGVAMQVAGDADEARKRLFPLTKIDDRYIADRALLYLREPWQPSDTWGLDADAADTYVERLTSITSPSR